MRFISILLFTFLFSTFSFGQFQKNTWTISANSGTLAFVSDNAYTLASSTEFGYFFSKNILTGIHIQYIRADSEAWEIAPNPYFRYYFTPNKSIKLYGQISPDLSIVRSYSSTQTVLSPKLNLGFNHFLQKNIALELGFGVNAFTLVSQKSWGFNASESFTNFFVRPQLGIRLFLNTDDSGTITYRPEDYLKRGNVVFGTYGDFISRPKNDFLYYNLLLNVEFFISNSLSVGTAVQLSPASTFTGYDNELTFAFASGIQYYRRVANDNTYFVAHISGEISPQQYTAYNFGFTLNRFIEENISLGAGPFLVKINGGNQWLFSPRVGVSYFMMSKKNRWHK